jgi:hypothetical protein
MNGDLAAASKVPDCLVADVASEVGVRLRLEAVGDLAAASKVPDCLVADVASEVGVRLRLEAGVDDVECVCEAVGGDEENDYFECTYEVKGDAAAAVVKKPVMPAKGVLAVNVP